MDCSANTDFTAVSLIQASSKLRRNLELELVQGENSLEVDLGWLAFGAVSAGAVCGLAVTLPKLCASSKGSCDTKAALTEEDC